MRFDRPVLNAPWRRFLLARALPLLLLAFNAVRVLQRGEVPFDTERTYLPLARLLLLDPAAFLASPVSLLVGPGNYFYMALFGARFEVLEWIDLALALAGLLLLADAARRTGGWLAGAAVAWLYALSPLLARYLVVPQSEPAFLFMVTLWFWCVGWLLEPARPHASGTRAGRMDRHRVLAIALLGGIALAGATLIRGTWLYAIPLALGAAGLIAWRGRGLLRQQGRRLFALHLVALLLVGGVLLRNLVVFDRAIIATGTGQALYLGSNPLLAGYEPPWFGLLYDDSTVTGGHFQHLTLDGDRRLQRVARAMLGDTPWTTLASMYLQKAGALLFFSKAHLDDAVFNDRAWRVLLVVLAAIGAWRSRRRAFAAFVVAALVYQWIVHWPVLYNPRYAVGALGLPLTVLAGLGVADIARAPRWRRAVLLAAGTVAVGIAAGVWQQRHGAPALIALQRGPHLLLDRAAPDALGYQHLSGPPWLGPVRTTATDAEVVWRGADLTQGERAALRLGVATLDVRCEALRLEFENRHGERTHQRVALRGRRADASIAIGVAALALPLRQGRHGTLRIGFECPAGAAVQLEEIALYRVSMGLHYGAALLEAPAAREAP